MSAGMRRILVTHLSVFTVFWTGVSAAALGTALVTYLVRMFAITAGFHRYFSHRAFKTSRAFQFVLAFIGAAAGQRGALWWAARHRHHHRTSDTPEDVHSPVSRGFLEAHIGWLARDEYRRTDLSQVPDLARYPELVWLDRWYGLVLALLAAVLGAWGAWLGPAWNTSAAQMIAWAFFVSTLATGHATMCINSICHRFGYRSYETDDNSRNSVFVAVIALGDGWHNNHHRFPGDACHGRAWWEVDLTYVGLRALARVGLVWDLAAC